MLKLCVTEPVLISVTRLIAGGVVTVMPNVLPDRQRWWRRR